MNFIKISAITLMLLVIEQFATSCETDSTTRKQSTFQLNTDHIKFNNEIYHNFAKFLSAQFSEKKVVQFMLDAQAMSYQHAQKTEFVLNIAAIKFSRLSDLEQKKLSANSIEELLLKMRTSYLHRDKNKF